MVSVLLQKCCEWSSALDIKLNVLMRMKMMWIICYGLHSHHIATQLNSNGRFWSDVLDKNGKIVCIPTVELRELEDQCHGAMRLDGHLTGTMNESFAFNLSPLHTCLTNVETNQSSVTGCGFRHSKQLDNTTKHSSLSKPASGIIIYSLIAWLWAFIKLF